MGDLGSWSDNHLEPEEEDTVGKDWRGETLYGYEFGFDTPLGFVPEEEGIEYLYSEYGLISAQDVNL